MKKIAIISLPYNRNLLINDQNLDVNVGMKIDSY